MPLILIHPRQPPEGHHYPEADGLIHRAKSIPDLIANIRRYRINNALPAGNPALEVERYYEVKFPWLVSKFNKGETEPAPLPEEKDEFLRDWVNRMWKNPPKKWQEKEKYRERMAICELCPHRMDSGNVSDVYLRRLITLGAGRFDINSCNCAAHRWSSGLAAWIEVPEVAKAVDGCWANPKM